MPLQQPYVILDPRTSIAGRSLADDPRMHALTAMIAVDQLLLRAVCAALIARILDRSPDPAAARRDLAAEMHGIIDALTLDAGAHAPSDRQRARLNVEALLRLSNPRPGAE